MEEKPKKPRKYKDPNRSVKFDAIGRLTEVPESKLEQRKFWPRELKIINELFDSFSVEFWSKVSFEYKMASLAFLKSERGEKELEKKWKEFNYIPPSSASITYESEKIGQDAPIVKIPSLLDFLKPKGNIIK
jgi:SAM-dependent MidA family methyltransferase